MIPATFGLFYWVFAVCHVRLLTNERTVSFHFPPERGALRSGLEKNSSAKPFRLRSGRLPGLHDHIGVLNGVAGADQSDGLRHPAFESHVRLVLHGDTS